MKKTWTYYLGGIAVSLLFGVSSALCNDAATDSALSDEANATTRIAANIPATGAAVIADHPLIPVIRWAEKERPNIAAIKDYTAILQKQENIGGKLQGAQVLEVKVRHEPFSVYTKFRFPQEMNGQQAIYVKGQNDGKLIGHGVGLERKLGTLRFDPDGFIPMRNQKYPITEMGILNLVDKLLEVGYRDSQFGGCEVTYTEGVVIGTGPSARECTMIQVTHPKPRANVTFHIARIFVDKELNVPIRYESYDWPQREGETPALIEAYTYMNLKLNVGLTDADFDQTNPAYAFP